MCKKLLKPEVNLENAHTLIDTRCNLAFGSLCTS